MVDKVLLPTDKCTAHERLDELLSEEYRSKHSVEIRSVSGYDRSPPKVDINPLMNEFTNNIRVYPDGYEIVHDIHPARRGEKGFRYPAILVEDGSVLEHGRNWVVRFEYCLNDE